MPVINGNAELIIMRRMGLKAIRLSISEFDFTIQEINDAIEADRDQSALLCSQIRSGDASALTQTDDSHPSVPELH